MKRFWLTVFFFAFCFSAAGAVFAAEGEPYRVRINYYMGPFMAVPEGRVVIELNIRDAGEGLLRDVPFTWELFKGEESTGKAGNGKTNTEGYSLSEITFDDLDAGGSYRLDVWVKWGDWTKDKIASLSFTPISGDGNNTTDVLVETERARPDVGGGGGGGCDALGLGAGLLALAGLALLKKRSGR